MPPIEKKVVPSARPKVLVTFVAIMVFCIASNRAFSQPPGPPTPPPPPGEVLNKINPFKKHKKDTLNKKDTAKTKAKQGTVAPPPGGPPPPPPSPLDLFKKKKKDTTKKPTPGTGN